MIPTQRIVSILAADVVGYSGLMNEDEAGTLTELRRIRDTIVEPTFAACGGSVVKRLGDGWLATFGQPADAVRSAASIQDQLASDGSLSLRIGIHVGPTSFVDDDVFGTSVNVASRLEALAVPGGITVSDAALAGVDPAIRSEFQDAGPRLLKNIPDPVRVWARGGLPAAPVGAADASLASVVVQPFSGSGGDPDLHAFADGLAAELETALARFRWLTVTDRDEGGSEGDPPARYVVGGAVRSSGKRFRVTAHLNSSSAGRRLWSDRFDRQPDDIFALQDELAATLSSTISQEIDANEKVLARMRPVETLTATELSIRTNDILSTGRVDAFDEADALTARAVALQPHNAQAHVQRSLVVYRKGMSGAWPASAMLTAALEPAREAVRLDPRLASGHGMLACIHGMLGETDRALDAAARTTALNPNAWAGDHGESIAYTFALPEWAAERDPTAAHLIDAAERTLRKSTSSAFRSGHLFFVGIGLLLRDADGDLSPAIMALERSASTAGATWWPGVFLALAELRRGSREAAARRVREARDLLPALSLSAIRDLFGRSRIWPVWHREMAELSDLGLPQD